MSTTSVLRTVVSMLEARHVPNQHNPYSLRELYPELYAQIDAALEPAPEDLAEQRVTDMLRSGMTIVRISPAEFCRQPMNTDASVMVESEAEHLRSLAKAMRSRLVMRSMISNDEWTRKADEITQAADRITAMLAAAPAQAAPLSMLALMHGDGEVTPEMIAAVKAKDCDGMPLSYREIYMVMHKARPAAAPAQAAPELPEPAYRTNDSETPGPLFSAAQMHAFRIAEPCYCRRCHPTLGEPSATPPATAPCVSNGGLTAAEVEALERMESALGDWIGSDASHDNATILCAAVRRLSGAVSVEGKPHG